MRTQEVESIKFYKAFPSKVKRLGEVCPLCQSLPNNSQLLAWYDCGTVVVRRTTETLPKACRSTVMRVTLECIRRSNIVHKA